MEITLNGLYIVATPIGNMGDISNRAIDTLKNVEFIICENPNHSRKLMSKFGIKKKLVSLHDHNEEEITKNYIEKIKQNPVALISDAGSPLVSDPGYKLLRQCIKEKIFVTTVPGASSIISALQLSGLPVNDFVFMGFAPKSKKKLFDFLKHITSEKRTVVFFVSSHKIAQSLTEMSDMLPDRKVSVCKEITKLNEKVFYGFPKKVLNVILSDKKYSLGEFVVVVEGEKNDSKIDKKNISSDAENAIKRLLEKFSLTETVEIVHKISFMKKNKYIKRP
jgi:probable S-adenosylmethionine-dependent methyltransferase, YraL family